MSFRVTMSGNRHTDRGFRVIINHSLQQVQIEFDYRRVDPRRAEWLESVRTRVGDEPLNPTPYWPFNIIMAKTRKKLENLLYVIADRTKLDGIEHFQYNEVWCLEKLDFERFLGILEDGVILIDFDAHTHHNHGTKFRSRDAKDSWSQLYRKVQRVL